MDKIELGDRARCMVTGAQGIVVARANYIDGIQQLQIQPEGCNPTTGAPLERAWLTPETTVLVDKNPLNLPI